MRIRTERSKITESETNSQIDSAMVGRDDGMPGTNGRQDGPRLRDGVRPNGQGDEINGKGSSESTPAPRSRAVSSEGRSPYARARVGSGARLVGSTPNSGRSGTIKPILVNYDCGSNERFFTPVVLATWATLVIAGAALMYWLI